MKLGLLHNLENKAIIVTGSGGMLGSAFQEILSKTSNKKVSCFTHAMLDVTDRKKVLLLSRLKPQVIIHCAAKVDADFCEDNPKLCRDIKVLGTKNIIDLAKRSNAKIFYPQSFLIFGNSAKRIDESTRPRPLSVYGKCKLEAEKLLLNDSSKHLIVRMGGMFGGCEKDKNFVGKFARHLAECIKENVKFKDVGDRLWQPTYTKDLAYNSLILLSREKTGIYSMGAHGEATFYQVAREIAAHFKLPVITRKISSKTFVEKAKRPDRAILFNAKLKSEGLDFQRHWKISLHEYLDDEYFRRLFQ